ncbi:hypothetical protein HCUR_00654 [Holospora curviuscula]|uniref:Uncharacterized protein n=2 Tax=Holospora curviuscula TaxID=1082868 RepID=A0A2S5R975_9PROT|nr:hypothetical protein HCUR_00654 [Holospora curviuscula]
MAQSLSKESTHSVVDIQFTLMHGTVYDANQHDTVRECNVFQEPLKNYSTLKGVCADAEYRKTMLKFVENVLNQNN